MKICINNISEEHIYNLDKIESFMVKNFEDNNITCVNKIDYETDKNILIVPFKEEDTVTGLKEKIESIVAYKDIELHIILIELNETQEINNSINLKNTLNDILELGFTLHTLEVQSIETSINLPLQIKDMMTLVDYAIKLRK